MLQIKKKKVQYVAFSKTAKRKGKKLFVTVKMYKVFIPVLKQCRISIVKQGKQFLNITCSMIFACSTGTTFMHKITAMMYLSQCCFDVSHKWTFFFLIMHFCGHNGFVIHTNCRINLENEKKE
ncbi:hypothetical protein GDO81_008618 [Engystomops pustulosus]|uniref:Uncharacterized protein n=1 Tax=Engystomops pustulosus TaxID=76066 RepID=A0AAV7CIM3_ENGPU|nr:hypothetical protein GDO81_008618 [Engystomops pustulosus]